MVRAYLFDLDGVLTPPDRQTVVAPQLLAKIVELLGEGHVVGFNTGRPADYVEHVVLRPLRARVADPGAVERIFAICEKGAVRIHHGDDARPVVAIGEKLQVSRALARRVRALVQAPRFADVVFFDETKLTMLTVQMRGHCELAGFHALRDELVAAFNHLLQEESLDGEFRVDPTQIAVDIERAQVGKALGTRVFIDLHRERGIDVDEYFAFGDSRSDYDMILELRRLRNNTV